MFQLVSQILRFKNYVYNVHIVVSFIQVWPTLFFENVYVASRMW